MVAVKIDDQLHKKKIDEWLLAGELIGSNLNSAQNRHFRATTLW